MLLFAHHHHRLDFADTRLNAAGAGERRASPRPARGREAQPGFDPLEQIAQADAADLQLLRLVGCAALATLLLALACAL
jgi:hypothetical protein